MVDFFQMIDRQDFDNLYHCLVCDVSLLLLLKAWVNHNLEFALEMMGTLSVSMCTIMAMSAQFLDFLLFAYLFDVGLTRYVTTLLLP